MVKKSSNTTKRRSSSSKKPDARNADTLSAAGSNVDELAKAIELELGALPQPNVEGMRSVRRQFSRQLAQASPEKIIELAQQILRRSGVIPRFVAYELIQHHKPALQSLTAATLEDLGNGNASWDEVDTFACYLSGPVWRERQVPDKLIERWARSKDRWWRRTALVSTVPLNNKARGGRGDAKRTLRICRMLVEDRDDMVVKALSWALRELSKRHLEPVKKFLEEHEDALAPRVMREVKNKLRTGLKNPR